MRVLLTMLAVCLVVPAACDLQQPIRPAVAGVSGDTVRVDGGLVLTVRGTHAERGYAHGYLLGRGIKQIFDSMYVRQLFQSNDSLYAVARTFVAAQIVIEQQFWDEATGVVRGMRDAGIDMRQPALGRSLDSLDIIVMNCLEELYDVVPLAEGCESLSSWGAATADDAVLAGELVITRHWDYARYPSMIANLALIVHIPSEPDEQRWVCAGWAGVIGSCSGMNAARVGAFLDYGVVDTIRHPGPFRPVSFSLRRAIESRDYDGDGLCTPLDVVAAYRAHPSYFPAIIHAVAPVNVDPHALIVEVNNDRGVFVRDSSSNMADTPYIPGPHLVATNHFRVLYPPRACAAYAAISDSLQRSIAVDTARNALIVAGAAGWTGNIYRVQFVPARGIVRWGCSQGSVPAYQRPFNEFSLDELLR